MKIHKLLQLLKDNADEPRSAMRAEVAADGVHIYCYDIIDGLFGYRALDLVRSLVEAGGQDVHMHYNCPGGDVFEARAMQAALTSYSGKVFTHIDSLCASAATYPALAAESVEISPSGMIMIHNSWTMVMGDCGEMRQTADLLEKIDGTIIADYCLRTGKPADQVATWMQDETWFTADEALAEGFVDTISEPVQTKKQDLNRWNLTAYTHAPRQDEPEPAADQDLSAQIAAQLQHNRNRLRLLDQA
jgi:ATP-dependent Clp protease protease subunit